MYRNIATYIKNGKQVIWLATWDSDGKRVEEEHTIRPYLYFEDSNFRDSPWKSMNGKPLRRMEFENVFDRSDYIKSSKNIPLFEKLSPEKQFLLDEYCGQERSNEFMQFPLRTFFFDIEVEIDGCFPEPAYADYPINVISIYDTLSKTIYVWTYKKDIFEALTDSHIERIRREVNAEYEDGVGIEVFRFDKERKLLDHFLDWWQGNYPDVMSGWNIDGFDVIYLINRIRRVMPQDSERRLSPIGWNKHAVKAVKESSLRETVVRYHIMGISICDYMNLHKKFILKSQQSYKLDYIAKQETNKGKLDYYELGYDSMQDFMRRDFATFVKYNIIDSTLVKQIDDNRHFIRLMRRICNMGLCEYECIFRSIPYILGGLCIEARHMGVKFLTDANRDEDSKFESDGFEGAFVFPTIPGAYTAGVMSYDFNSLYPSCIMTCNISPETMVGKVITDVGEEDGDEVYIQKPNGKTVKMARWQFNDLLDKKCSIAANNVLYMKSTVKWGIIPSFLDKLYKGRVQIKSEMKQNKRLAHDLDEEIKALEAQLKAME